MTKTMIKALMAAAIAGLVPAGAAGTACAQHTRDPGLSSGSRYAIPTLVVLVTDSSSEAAVRQLATVLVQEGFVVDLPALSRKGFSTRRREVRLDEDLEFGVELAFEVTLAEDGPLRVFHVGGRWHYADQNPARPMQRDPALIAAYKSRYRPVYGRRIQSFAERMLSKNDFVLMVYPLVE